MAFHIACPITCKRVCDCELGFPEGLRGWGARSEFLKGIGSLEEFLRDPWSVRAEGGVATVQVAVPRVVPSPALPSAAAAVAAAAEDGGADGEEAATAAASSAHAKRVAMQAVAASLAAEDYVRMLESGGAAEVQGVETKDQGSSTAKIMCRICFSGEKEGSGRAVKMLSCKLCSKKYHRSCLRNWAEYRDLFHWSSWACPSCRICEVCRRAGDPNKLMYCKRCDAAYHCYCQQPLHKNVSHGPYLCPKHTRCHSCGSNVPGSGLSTRWFLGYTCCDACGRLFVKGNYCPVCLKVYRDSETTPMVCCDVCERWVHCTCDGISDEKYQQFQSDQNLHYKCAACRGDCYQVKDTDDAVRELWKRRDEADQNQIASLRAAAGLPSQEEILSLSPYSDDEQSGPVILKNDSGRVLKFSVKGFCDKSTDNSKDLKLSSPNKKYPKKKGYQVKFVHKREEPYQDFEGQHNPRSLDSCFRDNKIGNLESNKSDGSEFFSNAVARNGEAKSEVNQLGSSSHSEVQIKGGKFQGLHIKECAGKTETKSETLKGTKLVIHIGAKNRNSSNSPKSETSSCHREQDTTACNDGEHYGIRKTKIRENNVLETHGGISKLNGKGAKSGKADQARSSKHEDGGKNMVKLGKVTDRHIKRTSNIAEVCELSTAYSDPISEKRARICPEAERTVEEAASRKDDFIPKKQPVSALGNKGSKSSHSTTQGDLKPLLKLKFKNPYFEQQSSWAPRGEEENPVKGQRSKRKRPSGEKAGLGEKESSTPASRENPSDEAMDAKILQKLGKDAIGKRVEVHQPSDNSWHQGVVSSIVQGSSSLMVRLDDGRSTILELGKQGVRFGTQKLNRTSM